VARGRAVAGDGGGPPQGLKDRHALADQAGDDLVDALGAVEDGEVGVGQAAGGRLDQGGQDLDDVVGGDEFLVAFAQRGGPGLVRVGLAFGGRSFRVGGGVGPDLDRLGFGFGQRGAPVGLRLGLEPGLVGYRVGAGSGWL